MDSPPTSNPIPGAIVVGKTYDLVLWIVQKVEKFPKSYRFSVGQRLIDVGLWDSRSATRHRSSSPMCTSIPSTTSWLGGSGGPQGDRGVAPPVEAPAASAQDPGVPGAGRDHLSRLAPVRGPHAAGPARGGPDEAPPALDAAALRGRPARPGRHPPAVPRLAGPRGLGRHVAAPALAPRICYLCPRCGAIGPGGSRRVLGQQSAEHAGVEPQQQLARQPQQQSRLSLCPGGGTGGTVRSPAARTAAITVAAGARSPRPGPGPGHGPAVTEH